MNRVSMYWRRLDTPGHDACVLEMDNASARLRGAAVFLHGDVPAQLQYEVVTNAEMHCLSGRVSGSLGDARVETSITRDARWRIDGRIAPGVDRCVDLDFGFTPATNWFPLRRLALAVGESAEAPAAWLDVGSEELVLLPQRYTRRTQTTWWYESPTTGYAAELEVLPTGFTSRYPGLWTHERG
jgi:hypothetical protein